jgi:predicted metalloprotease
VFQGYAAPLSTACGVLPLRNAVYCPVNAGVYYDSNFLADYLNLVGDMAPAFIISHELGHHVSWLLNWPPYLSPKEAELQADCFGGAWTADAEVRGLLEEGDLDEAVSAVISAGDPDETWFDPTMHGTAAQRLAAFDFGYSGGPEQCVSTAFFDAFPVSGP